MLQGPRRAVAGHVAANAVPAGRPDRFAVAEHEPDDRIAVALDPAHQLCVVQAVPRAELVDDAGNLIVKHSGGPTWTATADGSAVTGTVQASAPSPAGGPAIPWLLLSTIPKVGAPVGLLTDTKFIQRLETKGGTAPPTAECKAQTAGKVKEVPYKADYYFWK